MTTDTWPTRRLSVASLHLDAKNPRLGRETSARAPREIIQYLFDHDKALEVAESITHRGYFPNEPLLAIEESGRYVVVEGNRRLAALKALREPGLLEGSIERQVERLARCIADVRGITKVPVTIAPSRRATPLAWVWAYASLPRYGSEYSKGLAEASNQAPQHPISARTDEKQPQVVDTTTES